MSFGFCGVSDLVVAGCLSCGADFECCGVLILRVVCLFYATDYVCL